MELPFLKFHICPLFCTAFVGTFEQLTSCPYVTLRDQIDSDYIMSLCRSDQIGSGTTLATAFLFYELLKMKGFLPLFLHDYKNASFNSKYKYMDASDGIVFTRTLKEMEENFKRLYPDNSTRSELSHYSKVFRHRSIKLTLKTANYSQDVLNDFSALLASFINFD
jgi:hypothetical protein